MANRLRCSSAKPGFNSSARRKCSAATALRSTSNSSCRTRRAVGRYPDRSTTGINASAACGALAGGEGRVEQRQPGLGPIGLGRRPRLQRGHGVFRLLLRVIYVGDRAMGLGQIGLEIDCPFEERQRVFKPPSASVCPAVFPCPGHEKFGAVRRNSDRRTQPLPPTVVGYAAQLAGVCFRGNRPKQVQRGFELETQVQVGVQNRLTDARDHASNIS